MPGWSALSGVSRVIARMRFFGSSPALASALAVALPTVATLALDQIAIFRVDGVAEGWVEQGSPRISDILNRGAPISVRPSPRAAPRALELDDVIALALQVQPSPSLHRMARRRHILELEAPPYRVRGTVHMPPGADPARYLRAAPQRWTALTKATIVSGDHDAGYEIEILLVNMEHVARR